MWWHNDDRGHSEEHNLFTQKIILTTLLYPRHSVMLLCCDWWHAWALTLLHLEPRRVLCRFGENWKFNFLFIPPTFIIAYVCAQSQPASPRIHPPHIHRALIYFILFTQFSTFVSLYCINFDLSGDDECLLLLYFVSLCYCHRLDAITLPWLLHPPRLVDFYSRTVCMQQHQAWVGPG